MRAPPRSPPAPRGSISPIGGGRLSLSGRESVAGGTPYFELVRNVYSAALPFASYGERERWPSPSSVLTAAYGKSEADALLNSARASTERQDNDRGAWVPPGLASRSPARRVPGDGHSIPAITGYPASMLRDHRC